MYRVRVACAGLDKVIVRRCVGFKVPAIDLDQGVKGEVETSDEAEIPRAPFERPEKIGVGISVDLQDVALSGDELVTDNVVGCPARD